jgi:hypothetical protein
MLASLQLLFSRLVRVFRLKNRSAVVWKDLLVVFRKSNYYYAIEERGGVVTAQFTVGDETSFRFLYGIADDELHMRVELLHSFDIELTGEMMILAGHFNNRISRGLVEVNPEEGTITFAYREPIIQYLFFVRNIDEDIIRHYMVAKDVLWAFQQLQETREDPVFVFSELMRKREAEDNQRESSES